MLSPLVRSSQELVVHALEHFTKGDIPLDFKLAILHLDQAIELLLKDKVRNLGESIYKKDKKSTIGMQEIYSILEEKKYSISEKVNLELLHDERNIIQHKFSNPDEETASFHVQNAMAFIERFFFEEYNIKLNDFVPQYFLQDSKLQVETLDKKVTSLLKTAGTNVLRDPSSSLLSAVTALESVLTERFKELDDSRKSRYWTRNSMLTDLNKAGIIDENELSLFRKYFDIKNKISHTDYLGGSEVAEEVVTNVYKIIGKLHNK